ncbi:YkgJ family cysteine cluster protein [Methylotetracoccus oryzae]|uniref:YkgJ family cysteine cluster protein n=1 Tax=Methylotetracoccus oryzae TaxID=1919059 RepID=UPI001117E4A3|nr:YkgJ family cysteine cluster protein [Methylotetracoccus oryzae]
MTPTPPNSRPVVYRYADPLDVIWIACAARVGYRVERSREVYASTDGRGTLLIGTDDILDADDSLAQMILHELCHALIEGEGGEALADWGLDNTSNRHLSRERACLRLQAYLAGSFGLRDFMAPTTDFRVTFWNSLPADPFAAPEISGGRREASCVAARIGAWRAAQARWAEPLAEALQATADIANRVAKARARPVPSRLGDPGNAAASLPPLWDTSTEPSPLHPAGHAAIAGYHPGHGCADCAWSFVARRHRRCRHAPAVALPDSAPACVRWEAAEQLDCRTCGACCREAYQAVEIAASELVNRKHPELVEQRATHRRLKRAGERCAALCGGETPAADYGCQIYPSRPRSCREFERGGEHCLDARRRVGLSL